MGIPDLGVLVHSGLSVLFSLSVCDSGKSRGQLTERVDKSKPVGNILRLRKKKEWVRMNISLEANIACTLSHISLLVVFPPHLPRSVVGVCAFYCYDSRNGRL